MDVLVNSCACNIQRRLIRNSSFPSKVTKLHSRSVLCKYLYYESLAYISCPSVVFLTFLGPLACRSSLVLYSPSVLVEVLSLTQSTERRSPKPRRTINLLSLEQAGFCRKHDRKKLLFVCYKNFKRHCRMPTIQIQKEKAGYNFYCDRSNFCEVDFRS